MTVKVTWYWNFNAQGWSETWYAPAETLPTSVANLGKWDDIYDKRDQLVARQGIQLGYRLTDPNGQRKTIIKRYPATAQNGNTVIDVATNAWLCLASVAGGGGTRQCWLRGVDDDWTVFNTANNSFVPAGSLNRRFGEFRDAAIKFPLGLRKVASWDAAAFHKDVTTVTPIGAGLGVQLVIKNPAPPTAGVPIIVSGFRKPLSRLNGTYVSGSWDYTAPNLTLTGVDVSAAAAAGYVGGGKVRSAEYTYQALITLTLFQPRERRVGRAFFVPRGRRPKR